MRRHAGQSDCRYWTAFSNSIKPHHLVPNASNPDYEPAFDSGPLHEYLTTILGNRGETSLFVLEAVASGLLDWIRAAAQPNTQPAPSGGAKPTN